VAVWLLRRAWSLSPGTCRGLRNQGPRSGRSKALCRTGHRQLLFRILGDGAGGLGHQQSPGPRRARLVLQNGFSRGFFFFPACVSSFLFKAGAQDPFQINVGGGLSELRDSGDSLRGRSLWSRVERAGKDAGSKSSLAMPLDVFFREIDALFARAQETRCRNEADRGQTLQRVAAAYRTIGPSAIKDPCGAVQDRRERTPRPLMSGAISGAH